MAPSSDLTVTTNRYDNGRSGWNSKETILNTTNVKSAAFGLLFSRPYMGKVYNMPLYVGGLTIKGAKKNVVFVGTEHNMMYAFDADDPAANTPLWTRMLEAPLPLPIRAGYPSCQDLTASGEVGVTSTPVIDLPANKMYLVSKTSGAQNLHALDLTTGEDVAGSPVKIATMGFDSNQHLNRPGLLLQDGVLYIGFGSHCDDNPYHGWIFGYDAKTLAQTGSFNVSPSGIRGAVWQSGMGLAGDDKGVYFVTGNGDFTGANASLSVLRLNPRALTMGDRFTPGNAGALNGSDWDLTAGVVFLGNTGLMVSGGKEGVMYLQERAKLSPPKQTIKMTAGPSYRPELHNFAYMENSAGQMVYVWPDDGTLTSYKLTNGMLAESATNTIRPVGYNGGHPGGIVTLSSDGAKPGTAIVWGTISVSGNAWHGTAQGEFFAFDAANVAAAPLFRSGNFGPLAKFSPPLVANGKVYVATFSGKLNVYGLK
jgi:hypothetical protein